MGSSNEGAQRGNSLSSSGSQEGPSCIARIPILIAFTTTISYVYHSVQSNIKHFSMIFKRERKLGALA